MNRLRHLLADLLFAWWDGVVTISIAAFTLTAWAVDFGISGMREVTRMNAKTADALVPEAHVMLATIDSQRSELHESIRVAIVKLDKLDAMYARIQHVGRKQ